MLSRLLEDCAGFMTVRPGRPIAPDGMGFAVREGNSTVAAGTVTELLD